MTDKKFDSRYEIEAMQGRQDIAALRQELAEIKQQFKRTTARLYDLSRYCEALQRDNDKYHKRESALRYVLNPPAWDVYDRDLTEVQKFIKDFKPTDEPPPPGLIMEQTRLDKPEYFGPLALNDKQLAKELEFMAAQFAGIARPPEPGDVVVATFSGRDFGRFTVAADGRTLVPAEQSERRPVWPVPTPPDFNIGRTRDQYMDRNFTIIAPDVKTEYKTEEPS